MELGTVARSWRIHLRRPLASKDPAIIGRNFYGSTRVDTYPVQASLMAYLFPTWRISPFSSRVRDGISPISMSGWVLATRKIAFGVHPGAVWKYSE